MVFVIFVTAWLFLLIMHLASGGELEEGSFPQFFSGICIGVVIFCGIYVMFVDGFWGGLGIIGSLAFFSVERGEK